jgi:dihydrodipicolinate synthase/N-acetylneuraminate lyase
MNVQWTGVYSALLTPFTNDNKIDADMFAQNLNAQLDAGIDAAVIGGSLGEASTLLDQEKLSLIRIAKECMNRQVPVIMNIAEQSTRGAVAAARNAEKYGADGLMLLPPMRYRADQIETMAFFRTVTAATGLPVMIYNNPHDYKIMVTMPMFEELAMIPSVQAVKESTRDVTNVVRMRNHFGDRFRILCGVDTLALEELALGADGWVGGLVDAFPAETVAIYQLMKTGRYTDALTIYRWFFPLLELDIHPKFVQYIKLAAMQTGIGSETVRAPRLPLRGEERARILQVIQNAMAQRPRLELYDIHAAALQNSVV